MRDSQKEDQAQLKLEKRWRRSQGLLRYFKPHQLAPTSEALRKQSSHGQLYALQPSLQDIKESRHRGKVIFQFKDDKRQLPCCGDISVVSEAQQSKQGLCRVHLFQPSVTPDAVCAEGDIFDELELLELIRAPEPRTLNNLPIYKRLNYFHKQWNLHQAQHYLDRFLVLVSLLESPVRTKANILRIFQHDEISNRLAKLWDFPALWDEFSWKQLPHLVFLSEYLPRHIAHHLSQMYEFWAELTVDEHIEVDGEMISRLGGLWPKQYAEDALKVSEMLGMKDGALLPLNRRIIQAKHRIPTFGQFFENLHFLADLVEIIVGASLQERLGQPSERLKVILAAARCVYEYKSCKFVKDQKVVLATLVEEVKRIDTGNSVRMAATLERAARFLRELPIAPDAKLSLEEQLKSSLLEQGEERWGLPDGEQEPFHQTTISHRTSVTKSRGTLWKLWTNQPGPERSFFRMQLSPELICSQDREKCHCSPGQRRLLELFRDYLDSFGLLQPDAPASTPDEGAVPATGQVLSPAKKTSALDLAIHDPHLTAVSGARRRSPADSSSPCREQQSPPVNLTDEIWSPAFTKKPNLSIHSEERDAYPSNAQSSPCASDSEATLVNDDLEHAQEIAEKSSTTQGAFEETLASPTRATVQQDTQALVTNYPSHSAFKPVNHLASPPTMWTTEVKGGKGRLYAYSSMKPVI